MFDLFLQAAWKVLVAGLVLGAGIPVLFAFGVRFTAQGVGGEAMTAPSSGSRAGYHALGIACFLLAAVAVALGITVIVASGLGKMVSFDHVLPTLVDKG